MYNTYHHISSFGKNVIQYITKLGKQYIINIYDITNHWFIYVVYHKTYMFTTFIKSYMRYSIY